MSTSRFAALLAGVWAGGLLAIAAIAAPAAFAAVAPDIAGRITGRMFSLEAQIGLAIAVVLLLLLRARTRRAASSTPVLLSADTLLVLGAIFCTVAGYFALQPMMVSARAGEGVLSFGVLHGVSAGFYALKTLLMLCLAWRLSAG